MLMWRRLGLFGRVSRVGTIGRIGFYSVDGEELTTVLGLGKIKFGNGIIPYLRYPSIN